MGSPTIIPMSSPCFYCYCFWWRNCPWDRCGWVCHNNWFRYENRKSISGYSLFKIANNYFMFHYILYDSAATIPPTISPSKTSPSPPPLFIRFSMEWTKESALIILTFLSEPTNWAAEFSCDRKTVENFQLVIVTVPCMVHDWYGVYEELICMLAEPWGL